MAKQRPSFLARLAERKMLARWAETADLADRLPVSDLRDLQLKIRPLSRELARIDRVATTRINGMANAIRKPRGTDWSYRPRLWRDGMTTPGRCFLGSPTRLDDESSVFHDCPLSEIGLRQVPTRSAEALSPFDFQLEVMHFEGSFLSLSIDLPASVLGKLQAHHLIEVSTELGAERPSEVYLRLNLRQDQQVKQLLQSVPTGKEDKTATFDLAYSDVKPAQVDKIWLDVIFPDPSMNRFTVDDLTITRRPRADF